MTREPLHTSYSPLSTKPCALLTVLLAVAAVALHGDDQKDQGKDKKPERPAHAAPAPAARPGPEARRETPPEPRREARPEPRHEASPASRSEPSPRREPAPSHYPSPAPEGRREAPPASRPSPTQDPSRFPAPRLEPLPRLDPAPGRESRPTPPAIVGSERRESRSPEVRLAPGRQVVRPPKGGEIHRTTGGVIREVHTPTGAVIRHSPGGVRQVEVVRPGGRIIVANAAGRTGYVQRPLVVKNQTYVQRTYVFNGVPQARVYRPWAHRGITYHLYMPTYYFQPAFYSWGYRPWHRSVHYRWGWEARPWYGYYGGYFSPYPSYASPAFWLADFLIATTLEAAYLAENVTSSTPPIRYEASVALTPAVKEAIAEEVRRQLEREKLEQSTYQATGQYEGQPALFAENGPKVFLVSGRVFAYSGDRECSLVEGDVLQLLRTPYEDDETAEVRVLASRASSCAKGSIISVRLSDLQEMQNHLRATLNQGLTTLQTQQGKEGLPALSLEERGTENTAFATEVKADQGAREDVTQAVREANRAEQELISQSGLESETTSGPATIRLGMSLAEVERAMGKPKGTVDLGNKKIYLYPNLKITFLKGRVSDVQ